jgi:hypothetical protein
MGGSLDPARGNLPALYRIAIDRKKAPSRKSVAAQIQIVFFLGISFAGEKGVHLQGIIDYDGCERCRGVGSHGNSKGHSVNVTHHHTSRG